MDAIQVADCPAEPGATNGDDPAFVTIVDGKTGRGDQSGNAQLPDDDPEGKLEVILIPTTRYISPFFGGKLCTQATHGNG